MNSNKTVTNVTVHGSLENRCCDLTGCCSDDSPESRQVVINFCDWESREEFVDWLESSGMDSLRKAYNNPGKEIKLIYRGSDATLTENQGKVTCIFME